MSHVEHARSNAVAAPWQGRRPAERPHRAEADARSTAAASERPWRADACGVLILLLLTGIVALDGLQQGRLLYRTDIVTQFLPWYTHLGERLRDFDIPGWLPYAFSGAPFAGDPQSGWGYLPAMVVFTVAPGIAGFNALILFHLLLAGLATYALARVLGMSVLGAVAAGAAYEFTGFLERVRCCTVHAQVAVWVPVAFLGIELAVRGRTWLARLGWWSLTGLAISQMLAGWLGQGAYYGLLAVGVYTVHRTVIAPPAERGSIAGRLVAGVSHGGAILAIGFGLAAASIWPRVEVVGRSLLADGDYEAVASEKNGWSVPVLVDRLLTDDDRAGRWYAGGAMLALALLAPFVARRRFSTSFLTVYTLGVIAFAMREFWLHDALYVLPQLAELHRHFPAHALTVFYVGPALLAGATVSALARPAVGGWRLALLGLLPIGLLLLVWDVFSLYGGAEPQRITLYAVAAVSALIVLAALVRHPLAPRLVGVGLLLAVFADPTGQLVVDRLESPGVAPLLSSDERPAAVVDGYTDTGPAARFLAARTTDGEPVRYFGYDPAQLYSEGDQRTYVVSYRQRATHALLVNNRGILLGLEDVQGYNPVQSARYVSLMEGINGVEQSYHQANVLYRGVTSPILPLLNARYVVVPAAVPAGRPDLLHLSQRHPTVYEDTDVRVLEDGSAMPRAWIVHEAQRVQADRTFKLLNEGRVEPRTEVLLDKDVERPLLETPDDPAAESVRVSEHHPDEITLDVEMAAAGVVVLSENYDPGWHAYLDGERVPVLAAYRALRAVPVPAGTHVLELRYEPPSLVRGLTISLGTALVVAAAAGLLWWRRASGRPALVGHRVEGWLAPAVAQPRRLEGVGQRLRRLAAAVGAVPLWLRLGGLTAAGAAVRLAALDVTNAAPALAQRLTTAASERPWSAALGLDGLHASSPPLFVAAAKVAAVVVGDRLADAVVTALAGAVTIPVVYALAARLLGRPAGWAAAALLTVSPLHLALSRSGEPAAAGLLVVAASYLALVAVARGEGRPWLVAYAASLVVALYVDPTTAYALVPQLLVGVALLRRDGRSGAGVLAAGAVALVAVLPWLVRLPDAADWFDVDRGRDAYLGASWNRLLEARPLAVGLDGLGSWLWGDAPAWMPAPAIVLLLGVVPAGLAGLAALRGRRPAALVCWATIVGAPVAAIAASLLTRGFAPATLAPALVGWVVLASAWLARGEVRVDARRWGAIGWTILILTSLVAIPASFDSRQGAGWRDASAELTSQAHLGLPIFLHGGDALADRSTVSLLVGDHGAVSGDDRWLSRPAAEQIDATELPGVLVSDGRPLDAFWLLPDIDAHPLRGPITDAGYALAMRLEQGDARLELWVQPDAALGRPVPIDGGFREPPNEEDTWRLTGTAAVEPTPDGASTLVIPGGSSRATYRLGGGPGLYLLRTEVLIEAGGTGRATVKCVDAGGVDLVKQTVTTGETTTPGAWRPITSALICPAGTEALALVLDRRGEGAVGFRNVTLHGSPTDFPTDVPVSDEDEAEAAEETSAEGGAEGGAVNGADPADDPAPGD